MLKDKEQRIEELEESLRQSNRFVSVKSDVKHPMNIANTHLYCLQAKKLEDQSLLNRFGRK